MRSEKSTLHISAGLIFRCPFNNFLPTDTTLTVGLQSTQWYATRGSNICRNHSRKHSFFTRSRLGLFTDVYDSQMVLLMYPDPLHSCLLDRLNKASINTDWWRKASSTDTFLCAFTGCCNAYSNDFKSIYTGPSFAYVPLDHNQSRLSLPTRFLHQLHAALPASARVLSVLEKLASVFTDVIIILTIMEGGNVNY